MALDGMDTYAEKGKRRVYIQNKCFIRVYMHISIWEVYSCKFQYLKGMYAKNPIAKHMVKEALT